MAIHLITFIVRTNTLDLSVLLCQVLLQEVLDVCSVEMKSSSSLEKIIKSIGPAAGDLDSDSTMTQ